MSMDDKLSYIKNLIKEYADFPKKGVLYKDIFSALSDGTACKLLKEVLIQYIKENFPDVQVIVALEARGFFFSFAISAELSLPCIPIRKKGKLPGEVLSCKYDLEYGSDNIEVQKEIFKTPGAKCLIIDDLIATGGTMNAAIKLLRGCNCDVIGCLAVIELLELNGKDKLSNTPLHSLIKF